MILSFYCAASNSLFSCAKDSVQTKSGSNSLPFKYSSIFPISFFTTIDNDIKLKSSTIISLVAQMY